MDLQELIRHPEGKTLEFKRDLSSPRGVLRTVVAFANTSGGTILIGVEDQTRHICGVSNPFAMEERIASLISDSLSPRLLPDLEILSFRNTHVLAIQVFPSASRPHHLTKTGERDGTYVRVGSTNRRADAELIGEMRRYGRGQGFDEEPMIELDSEAIDFRAASECFEPMRQLRKQDLEALHMVTRHQRRKVPTVAGILLFGKDRLAHFPDAWIQAGRFGGTDRSHVKDQLQLKGALPVVIEQAIGFVQKHLHHGIDLKETRRKELWSLPPIAVREAVINAVAHADYSQTGAPIRLALYDDRLEVESPGLLPFGLTVADLPLGVSKLRNRAIGRVLNELGFVEQWGSGIQRMIGACLDAGLPVPILEEVGIRFRVTIKTVPEKLPVIDEVDHQILRLLDGGQGLGTSQIAKGIGLSARATRSRLSSLVDRGVVREVGTGPTDPKKRYFASES